MIAFELSPQQKMLREMAHALSANEIRPIALECDRNGEVPYEFLKKLKTLGITNGEVPKEYGGEDLDLGAQKDRRGESQRHRISALGAEELAWGDPGVLLNLPGPGLGGPPIRFMGTPEQQKRFFSPFLTDEPQFGAYALTEPGAGSDVAAIRTTCIRDGDHYVLNGTKCFITNGARAVWNVVFATVDREQGRAGQRVFVVEKGTPGFTVGKLEKKMGLRASETAELVLEDCRVPVDNLLGGEIYYETRAKEGFKGAMKTFDATRPLVASMAVGLARAAYEIARDFVQEHYLLSRPIPRYRSLADTLARLATDVDSARLMVWRAAWMADREIPNSAEASMCKAFAAEVAQRTTSTAMSIMGPHGLLHEHFVEKLFRDQKVWDIFEGTGQVQRIVISRRVLQAYR